MRSFLQILAVVTLTFAVSVSPTVSAPYGPDEAGEVGDLIFRTSGAFAMYGIAGCNHPSSHPGHVGVFIGHANGASEMKVVEALGWFASGDEVGVIISNYDLDEIGHSYFMRETDNGFMGALTPQNGATALRRRNVALLALDQVGELYDEGMGAQKGPGTNDWICTGLAERMWESADLNCVFYSGDTLPVCCSAADKWPGIGGCPSPQPTKYAVDITPDGVCWADPVCLVKERTENVYLAYDIFMPATQMQRSTLKDAEAILPTASLILDPPQPNENGWYSEDVMLAAIEAEDPGGSGIYSADHGLFPPPTELRAFVTSTEYVGNLIQLYGADNKCQQAAMAAGLGNKFLAWLSDDSVDAKDQMSLQSGQRYVRVDGVQVADHLNDLTDGTIDNAIVIDEHGDPISENLRVWTGTGVNGQGTGNDCADWTSGASANTGTIGIATSWDAAWTEWITPYQCHTSARLYCFEQDEMPIYTNAAGQYLVQMLITETSTVFAKATDNAGYESDPEIVQIRIDKEAPEIVAASVSPGDGSLAQGSSITVEGSVTDTGGSGAEYAVVENVTTDQSSQCAINVGLFTMPIGLDSGTNELRLRVYDAAGNASDEVTRFVCSDADGDGYAYYGGGDGYCGVGDCDDANPYCSTDCTDVDADGACVTNDCDNANPMCTTDCTDADADGFCVTTDCDDGNASCSLDCADADADGLAVCEGDCRDGNPNCTIECTDVDGDGLAVCEGDCDDSGPPPEWDWVDDVTLTLSAGPGTEDVMLEWTGGIPSYELYRSTSAADVKDHAQGSTSDTSWMDTPPPGAAYFYRIGSSCVPGCEVCDGVDNDCDAAIDEAGSELSCLGSNGTPVCVAGACETTQCAPNWWDANEDPGDGCEYYCVVQSSIDEPEIGFVDANCDGIDGDLARAVFVSTSGDDGDDGLTASSPVRTIAKALTIATYDDRSQILVDQGDYVEDGGPLTLKDGVGIYGGYDSASGWGRSAAAVTHIDGATTAMAGTNLLMPTVLELLFIESANGTEGGESSYGVRAIGSPGLAIRHCIIVAGSGADGVEGAAPGPAGDGGAGANGQTGGCDTNSGGHGGDGGTSVCDRSGGKGGDGGYENSPVSHSWGWTGLPGVGGAAGGGAGHWDAGDGGHGANGSPGAVGADGAGAAGGWVVDGTWVGSNANDGLPGDAGGGGGGGGAGGGSFGVFLVDSAGASVTICSIQSGPGGSAGSGAAGGNGGQGGGGGSGGTYCLNEIGEGGDGGDGGAGGKGGAGGGGAGGPTIGILSGGNSSLVLEGNTFTIGQPGLGGSSQGISGADGERAEVYDTEVTE